MQSFCNKCSIFCQGNLTRLYLLFFVGKTTKITRRKMAKLSKFATQKIADIWASSEERGGKLGQGFPSLFYFLQFSRNNPWRSISARSSHRDVLPVHLRFLKPYGVVRKNSKNWLHIDWVCTTRLDDLRRFTFAAVLLVWRFVLAVMIVVWKMAKPMSTKWKCC